MVIMQRGGRPFAKRAARPRTEYSGGPQSRRRRLDARTVDEVVLIQGKPLARGQGRLQRGLDQRKQVRYREV